jgi:hypothetical protein
VTTEADPRPLGELFGALARDTGLLVRQEVELVKTEMSTKARQAARDAAIVVVGGVIAFLGAGALVASAVLALGTLWPLWLAALVVGGALAAVGAIAALSGVRAIQNIDPVPRATVSTLKEDKRWLEEQVSR